MNWKQCFPAKVVESPAEVPPQACDRCSGVSEARRADLSQPGVAVPPVAQALLPVLWTSFESRSPERANHRRAPDEDVRVRTQMRSATVSRNTKETAITAK